MKFKHRSCGIRRQLVQAEEKRLFSEISEKKQKKIEIGNHQVHSFSTAPFYGPAKGRAKQHVVFLRFFPVFPFSDK